MWHWAERFQLPPDWSTVIHAATDHPDQGAHTIPPVGGLLTHWVLGAGAPTPSSLLSAHVIPPGRSRAGPPAHGDQVPAVVPARTLLHPRGAPALRVVHRCGAARPACPGRAGACCICGCPGPVAPNAEPVCTAAMMAAAQEWWCGSQVAAPGAGDACHLLHSCAVAGTPHSTPPPCGHGCSCRARHGWRLHLHRSPDPERHVWQLAGQLLRGGHPAGAAAWAGGRAGGLSTQPWLSTGDGKG